MAVELRNATGISVNSISVGGGYSVRIALKDAVGAPVASKLVNFSTNTPALASVSPATALTDAAGIAEVAIAPASVTAVGAATVTASASVGGKEVAGSRDFSITPLSLTLDPITAAPMTLDPGSNSSLSVTARIGGLSAAATPVNVLFEATCGRINSVDRRHTVTTNSGVAGVTYTALQPDGRSCSGSVGITASTPGAAPRTTTLQVSAPTARSVAFKSASPAQIYLAGSGLVEQSQLTFRVSSETGAPLANAKVNFGFPEGNNSLGLGLSSPQGTTNTDGEVTVTVSAGSIPGPAKVRAVLDANPGIFTDTQQLTVASGPPSQRFMTLSVQTYNIEGWDVAGTSTRLTVRLADRLGNAVEDGTVVNFVAEGGQVGYSCATRKSDNNISLCSVDFVSQQPRPEGGRVSVLAYTNGIKDYVDANGNNRFDADEKIMDLGNAFLDTDEDGIWSPGEFVIPRGGNLPCPAPEVFVPSVAGTCDRLLPTTVRRQAVVLFSSSHSELDAALTGNSPGYFRFRLRSTNNRLLPMPAGTKVEAAPATSGGTCKVDRVTGAPLTVVIPGTPPEDLSTEHEIYLSKCSEGEPIIITVTTPAGTVTQHPVVLPPAPLRSP